ncbi:hypothetical protein N6H18_09515 [Reichenbachiella agarivorans]|uniref:DUF4468 domain-containing protein n=1 Tax=Reichenbachiella agarivorans TaxID=2979464 RepID=A0ABY6CJ92_9BACT|nr:hypothetical protein [Reichenbachiella agarivorans]UXP30591.1 hypothetical protein N6H18_09515 [Reichenbachiella agarivorans]
MKITSILTLAILWTTVVAAQNYSLDVYESTLSIGTTHYKGFSTRFTQPYKEVKKTWWKYIRTKAHIFNNKTHYTLTVPPKKGESNTAIQFISVIENGSKQQSILTVAPIDAALSAEQLATLRKDLQVLLVDFKINYFTRILQQKIDQQEKDNHKLSKELHKQKNRNSVASEKLLQQLAQGQAHLESLKRDLAKIK